MKINKYKYSCIRYLSGRPVEIVHTNSFERISRVLLEYDKLRVYLNGELVISKGVC